VPGAEKTWHVWEAKSVNAKRFAELERQGVQAWSPEYYAQLQCYMGASGMERALFCAYCKDDSRLYTERVRFVGMEWAALQTKALRLLEATEPPSSSYKDKSWFEAKWMPPVTSAIYWRERLPDRAHCKNCRFSAPDLASPGAHWQCAMDESEDAIPKDVLPVGCAYHQWIAGLVPGELATVNRSDHAYVYRLPTGRVVENGPDGYSSQELAEASKSGFATIDNLSEALREDLGARIEQVCDPLCPTDDVPF
jgi:hypothetical protein